MQIGNLNNRVTLQQLPAGQDAVGQPAMAWAAVATVWADIRYLNGLETLKSDATVSVAKASIRIRRRTDITAGMRVVFGAIYFDIRAVLPDPQQRKWLDLACEVGANEG